MPRRARGAAPRGTGEPGPLASRRSALILGVGGALAAMHPLPARADAQIRGMNLVETPQAPFGSDAAAQSLAQIAALGANSVALIPFLWQSRPDDPEIVYGNALPLERLRLGVRQAHAAGLRAIVKPHVWVPERWAGTVRMTSERDWARWFAAYSAILESIAALAQAEGADTLMIGTELLQTSARPEWLDVIGAVRARFSGRIGYVAHGAEEAATVPFWPRLDAVAVSLYPPLGDDGDRAAWRRAMDDAVRASRAVSVAAGKPLWIAEIGLRSARGAAARPWESAEERAAAPDPQLQARVIDAWLDAAAAEPVAMMLIWRWFTDPDAGGAADTDFTVQNKPAARLLRRRWLRS